MKYGDVYGLEP